MSTVHVIPTEDLVVHNSEGDSCVCGPDLEAVPRDDGSMGWLVIHHSLDGREAYETNEAAHTDLREHVTRGDA